MEVIKQALEIEPSNDALVKYFEEIKHEYEEDNSLPNDHPEKIRFNKMLDWLAKGGS